MTESNELKKIKKIYGENFMKLCRELFPTLLETEGRLIEVLSLTFANNSRTLYDDIINNNLQGEFKNYIYSKIDVEDKDKKIIQAKTPYELLDEAGYILYECKTEEEIQRFKKYYAQGEELCTFGGGRLNRCEVFFAVRKDVDDIKRENFENPKREDEYGTSVMGIQFNKEGICTVSIKNRYNHTVNNPDATYGNDLDRIVPGLTQSFEELLKAKGLALNNKNIEQFEIPNYVVAGDGKYYKYNMEIDGKYYCPGNMVIEDGETHQIKNPEKQLLFDYFVLDIENKTVQLYDSTDKDSFVDDLQNFEKVEIRKNKEEGDNSRIIIIHKQGREEPIIIEIDKDNQIIGYSNKELTEVGDNFLWANDYLTKLNLPKLTQVGEWFLYYNIGLRELDLPKLTQVSDNFLYNNQDLMELNLPKLTKTGEQFLLHNEGLSELNLPQLIKVDNGFLQYNRNLSKLNLPKLIQVGGDFLEYNKGLNKLNLPELTKVGWGFLEYNKGLNKLNLPKLTQVDSLFLRENRELRELNLPQLEQVGPGFLEENRELRELNLPQLKQVGSRFLKENRELRELNLPQLTQVDSWFLRENRELRKLNLPNLTKVGEYFMDNNKELRELNLPNLIQVPMYFLSENKGLKEVILPQLAEASGWFLSHNKSLTKLEIPKLPGLEKKFADIIAKNQEKIIQDNAETITLKDIAILDKEHGITTSDINNANEIFEDFLDIDKNQENKYKEEEVK